MRRLHQNSGAALIVALSIMAVLLAIGLTFFAVTRLESTTAVNVVHTVRAQYLVDAGFAVAQYTLNRDLDVNPNATSTDHAWRTLFNGAAFAGKEWTWVDGIPPWAGGRTAFTLEPVERALRGAGLLPGGLLYAQFYRGDGASASPTPDGPREPLFRGPRTAAWLAVPRWSGQTILLYATADNMRLAAADGALLTLTDINNALQAAGRPERFERFDLAADVNGDGTAGDMDRMYPFVTPDFAGPVIAERPDGSTFQPFTPQGGEFFPANFVDLWADFDSDGDGLRDSVWTPLPKDVDLSLDGIDNDLDGYADNQATLPSSIIGAGLEATDEGEIRRNFELGAFVYTVDASGAVIREQDPDNPTVIADYRLTLPLPALSVPLDMDGDGDITPSDRRLNASNELEYVYLTLPDQLSVPGVPVSLTMGNVDAVDNDYDLHVNGFTAYAAPAPVKNPSDPNCPTASAVLSAKGLRAVNLDVVAPGFTVSAHANLARGADGCCPIILGVSAESVCEVIGRMAVHVADESGKANLNNAGLHTYGHQDVLEASALTSVERAAR
ncbi:MAG TPA: hypothetical protein PKN23_15500, partial [Candidatus Hydrogenedentes bacterium]|nr:hypothetical protein [Candidatus Hydrogenedentota bacterium]